MLQRSVNIGWRHYTDITKVRRRFESCRTTFFVSVVAYEALSSSGQA